MNNQGRIKAQRKNFSQVSNHALQDPNLSLKAKGLYGMIESYLSIPNFILYQNTLIKNMTDGETSFKSAWKELKDKGYLVQTKKRDNKKKTYFYEYELLEKPEGDFPPMENPPGGKHTPYNNTDLNNTNLNNTNNLQVIPDGDDYVDYYKQVFKRFKNKEHPRVSELSLSYIESAYYEIESQIELEDYKEIVIEHFETLPKSNNGNILAFLKTLKRHGIEIE